MAKMKDVENAIKKMKIDDDTKSALIAVIKMAVNSSDDEKSPVYDLLKKYLTEKEIERLRDLIEFKILYYKEKIEWPKLYTNDAKKIVNR